MHDFSTEYRLSDGSTTFSEEEWINDIKAQAWEEGLEAKFKLLEGQDSVSLDNPYRQGYKDILQSPPLFPEHVGEDE